MNQDKAVNSINIDTVPNQSDDNLKEQNLKSKNKIQEITSETEFNKYDSELAIDPKLFSIASYGMQFANQFINHTNNSQQNETTVLEESVNNKDFKINYNQVTLDPIRNFYDHISNSINEILDDFFAAKFASNKTNVDEIKELTDKIKKEETNILIKKKELKYRSKCWANGFIIFSFFLIIGLVFIPIFKKNLAIIREFKAFRNEKNKIIDNTINLRFEKIYYAVSTIRVKEIWNYVFERYGIKTSDKIPASKLIQLFQSKLTNQNIIDISNGIYGKYKNTPFYDVIYRIHSWEPVVTSRSESFPYYETVTRYDSNGKPYISRELRYETLTAFHTEISPFIYYNNALVLETNFEPNLSFSLQTGKSKKNIQLENKNFSKKYRITNYSDGANNLANQQLYQFFTIKAQEDYLKWHELNQEQIFSFTKLSKNYLIENKDFRINNLNSSNLSIDSLEILQKSKNIGWTETKNLIKNFVIDYFDKFSKMLQMPLLSPVVNRESFQNDGNYHISSFENENDNFNQNESFDDHYIIYRFLENNFLWFNNKRRADKPIWLELQDKKITNNNLIHYQYKMNSYWSKIFLDFVPVFGMHVGMKIIPVPYRRFYEMNENKFLTYVCFQGPDNKAIMVNKNLLRLLNELQYSNQDFAKIVKNNFIWTNDPNWFQNKTNINELIQIIEKFNQINQNQQKSLIIDEYGAYIISNDDNLITNNENQNLLLNIKKYFT